MSEEGGLTPDRTWSSFYRLCGVTTVLMMAFFLADVIAWVVLGPYPSTAEGWFTLLRNDRHTALLLLSFPTQAGAVLYYLTFLALGLTLRAVSRPYATLAALFAFVGLSIMLLSIPAHTLVAIADQHAAATTESRRALLLAAGEARLASSAAGSSMAGFFVEGAAVVFSILMLRSSIFGRTVAWLGIVGHGLDFVRIVMALAFLPEAIGAILLMIGGLPQLLWLALVGRKLYQLGRAGAPAQ